MPKLPNMHNFFQVGDIIYGYCNGYFGRDDYATKICAKVTTGYVLFEYVEDHSATVLNAKECMGLDRDAVEQWKVDDRAEEA
jgi:hypothetical protein